MLKYNSMTTQQKGDLAVSFAIAKLTELGFNVLIPLTESAQYDLVIEKENVFKRVQVKYITGTQVDLRRIHSNSKGYVIKKYENGFDILFIYKSSIEMYLIEEDLSGRSSITPRESQKI